ncbi:hypothetical protein Rumeso_01062 [Rubellimicrobium mesophilum DSM 19309]|uniref:Uncharacterized protein n=1 Tax=Rubellimicrobium mesophilum DSM 19309 TaxID=442562 RepID=A0A017HSP3_9RHOB|nr:hypothetical protein Rumeso_01062 [Rubellimicrobium mesophilum DSM 19309]
MRARVPGRRRRPTPGPRTSGSPTEARTPGTSPRPATPMALDVTTARVEARQAPPGRPLRQARQPGRT